METAPADFIDVLNHALTIVNWMENLPSDEMPDKWKWHLDWEIESHFQFVKEQRDKKYGTQNSGDSSEPAESYDSNVYASRFK